MSQHDASYLNWHPFADLGVPLPEPQVIINECSQPFNQGDADYPISGVIEMSSPGVLGRIKSQWSGREIPTEIFIDRFELEVKVFLMPPGDTDYRSLYINRNPAAPFEFQDFQGTWIGPYSENSVIKFGLMKSTDRFPIGVRCPFVAHIPAEFINNGSEFHRFFEFDVRAWFSSDQYPPLPWPFDNTDTLAMSQGKTSRASMMPCSDEYVVDRLGERGPQVSHLPFINLPMISSIPLPVPRL